MISICCGNCNNRLETTEEYAGKNIACTVCEQDIYVPDEQPKQKPAAGDEDVELNTFRRESVEVGENYAKEGPLKRIKFFKDKSSPQEQQKPDIDKALGFIPKPKRHKLTARQIKKIYKKPALSGFRRFAANSFLSLFLTLAAAVAWAVLVNRFGLQWLKWLSVLLILVAAAAGYGFRLFSKSPSVPLGLAAALLALVGLLSAKIFIAQWPGSSEAERIILGRRIVPVVLDRVTAEPEWMFFLASRYIAEKQKWDESFAVRVWAAYAAREKFKNKPRLGRLLASNDPKVLSAIGEIEETISEWDTRKKRTVAKALLENYRAKDEKNVEAAGIDVLSENDIKRLVISGAAADILKGKEGVSINHVCFLFAFIPLFRWFDFVIFPAGLWVAYRIGSG